MTLQIKQGCMSHIGRRHNQQDAYGFSDFEDTSFINHGGFLAVVCDGIGGMEKGEEASRLAVKTILDSYMVKSVDESVPTALITATTKANKEVTQLGVLTGNDGNIGTTLAAVAVYKDELFWCTAGDSRIYLFHGDKLTQLSADHSYAQELIDNQKVNNMSLEDIANHPEAYALTSFLGIGESIDFDQNKNPVKLQSGDSLLVCSDGVYNALNTTEIIEALQHSNAMKAAKELQHKVLDKQLFNQDNLTAVVFRVLVEEKNPHSFFSMHIRIPFVFSFVVAAIVFIMVQSFLRIGF